MAAVVVSITDVEEEDVEPAVDVEDLDDVEPVVDVEDLDDVEDLVV